MGFTSRFDEKKSNEFIIRPSHFEFKHQKHCHSDENQNSSVQ
jgi:hypothetical protein